MYVPSGPTCVCHSQTDVASRSPFMQKQTALCARFTLSSLSLADPRWWTLCCCVLHTKGKEKIHMSNSKIYHTFDTYFFLLHTFVINDLFLLEVYILAAVSPCLRPPFHNFCVMTLERSKAKVRKVEDSSLDTRSHPPDQQTLQLLSR